MGWGVPRARAGAVAKGAVACLVRSATARSLATLHTGMLRYDEKAARIPAAAVTVEAEFTERGALLAQFNAGDKVYVTYAPAPAAAARSSTRSRTRAGAISAARSRRTPGCCSEIGRAHV